MFGYTTSVAVVFWLYGNNLSKHQTSTRALYDKWVILAKSHHNIQLIINCSDYKRSDHLLLYIRNIFLVFICSQMEEWPWLFFQYTHGAQNMKIKPNATIRKNILRRNNGLFILLSSRNNAKIWYRNSSKKIQHIWRENLKTC